MKNNKIFSKKLSTIMLAVVALTFGRHLEAQGKGIGHNNGATIEHSAYVNKNGNNGRAGEGNKGDGLGNMPFGNQGINGNPNGRTGTRSTSIPLDGGLSILLLGAAAFGIRKLRNKA